MNYCIKIMEEEHANINRMIAVIEKIACGILEGNEVDVDEFFTIVDFIQNYADIHHHGKEEKFLFPRMTETLGKLAENLVTHGMLVEHNLGRGHVLELKKALENYRAQKSTFQKLNIITHVMGYARLLQSHTAKENAVVYTFAERALDSKIMEEINQKCREYEIQSQAHGIQKKYEDTLRGLEEKYLIQNQCQ